MRANSWILLHKARQKLAKYVNLDKWSKAKSSFKNWNCSIECVHEHLMCLWEKTDTNDLSWNQSEIFFDFSHFDAINKVVRRRPAPHMWTTAFKMSVYAWLQRQLRKYITSSGFATGMFGTFQALSPTLSSPPQAFPVFAESREALQPRPWWRHRPSCWNVASSRGSWECRG